jgi:DNA-binding NarL/FixJ family response regulator
MNLLGLVQERSTKFQSTFRKWFLSSDIHPSIAVLSSSRMLLSSFYAGTAKKELITFLSDNGNSFLDYLGNNQVGLLITTDQLQDMQGEALIKRALSLQPTLRTILLIQDQSRVNPQDLDYKSPVIVADIDMLTNAFPFRAALLAAIGNAAYRSQSVPEPKDKQLDSISIKLSAIETQMLEYFAEGLTLAEIAKKTHHTSSTIKTYSRNLLQKLGVNSRQKALMKAFQIGAIKMKQKL